MLLAVDWTQVIIALIAGLPGIIAAYASLHVKRSIRTPSGNTIGSEVESARHISIGNAHRLEAIRGKVGAPRLVAPPANEQPPTDPAAPPVE